MSPPVRQRERTRTAGRDGISTESSRPRPVDGQRPPNQGRPPGNLAAARLARADARSREMQVGAGNLDGPTRGARDCHESPPFRCGAIGTKGRSSSSQDQVLGGCWAACWAKQSSSATQGQRAQVESIGRAQGISLHEQDFHYMMQIVDLQQNVSRALSCADRPTRDGGRGELSSKPLLVSRPPRQKQDAAVLPPPFHLGPRSASPEPGWKHAADTLETALPTRRGDGSVAHGRGGDGASHGSGCLVLLGLGVGVGPVPASLPHFRQRHWVPNSIASGNMGLQKASSTTKSADPADDRTSHACHVGDATMRDGYRPESAWTSRCREALATSTSIIQRVAARPGLESKRTGCGGFARASLLRPNNKPSDFRVLGPWPLSVALRLHPRGVATLIHGVNDSTTIPGVRLNGSSSPIETTPSPEETSSHDQRVPRSPDEQPNQPICHHSIQNYPGPAHCTQAGLPSPLKAHLSCCAITNSCSLQELLLGFQRRLWLRCCVGSRETSRTHFHLVEMCTSHTCKPRSRPSRKVRGVAQGRQGRVRETAAGRVILPLLERGRIAARSIASGMEAAELASKRVPVMLALGHETANLLNSQQARTFEKSYSDADRYMDPVICTNERTAQVLAGIARKRESDGSSGPLTSLINKAVTLFDGLRLATENGWIL
ncbi:hypothetical protein JHW43_007351 [Diplocarpon mali]|nr:hypothetical protein JHW43_007351 [Diplocarpon mali]